MAEEEKERAREEAAQRRMERERERGSNTRGDFGRRDNDRDFGGSRDFGRRDNDRDFGASKDFGGSRDFGRRDNDRDFGASRDFGGSRDFGRRDNHNNNTNMDRDTGNFGARNDRGPPPMPQNSRFAAAAADYELERTREQKEREERRMNRENNNEGGGHRRYDDRNNYNNNRRNNNNNNQMTDFDFLEASKSKTDLTAPELPKHLQPKKAPEPVLPPVAAPLTLPGEDEAAAKARLQRKKEEADRLLQEQKRKEEEEKAKLEAKKKAEEEAKRKAAQYETDLLQEFASGKQQGEALKAWCEKHSQEKLLPSTDKLVYTLLTQNEKLNPNPDCTWAEPSAYGTALLSLVTDNPLGQMQVLWGIQKVRKFLQFLFLSYLHQYIHFILTEM